MNTRLFFYHRIYINLTNEDMFIFCIFVAMENRLDFYQQNIEKYTSRAAGLKKQIHIIGSIRLALAVGLGLCLWLCWEQSASVLWAIAVLFTIPFALLMKYHNKLFAGKAYTEALIALNQHELNGLNYDFSVFDGAPEKSTTDHSFCLDLDLFGNHSLFQAVNRTVTALGRERLADWFLQPLTDKEQIHKRQAAIRELGQRPALRQHFQATGITQQNSNTPTDRLLLERLLQQENLFLGKSIWQLLTGLVPVLWLLLILAVGLGWIGSSVLTVYFFISLIIANCRAKQINTLYNTVNKMEQIFLLYANLIQSIENSEPFQSEALKEISRDLSDSTESASRAIKRLSTYIGGLDQRFSLAGLIFNLLYLRDTRHAILLERWKDTYADKAVIWLEALARFDAYASLGNFAFNHPDYIYPQIADTYFKMEGKALGHPLLDHRTCVRNDIHIQAAPRFLIITGANMAGKSTYLRTVGVNYLLACIGAPVCAESLTVYPANLVTSLRTSDSLAGNESYFFAELKRLKMIIDRLHRGEKLFIILDEILKGTNSIDKQKGSLALVKQLIEHQCCGIIATHDLVLGTLADLFPGQINNYCFEADIKNNELSFSYRMREGIAQNMNACFLMQKMGITFSSSAP